jgi:hypothetical protein
MSKPLSTKPLPNQFAARTLYSEYTQVDPDTFDRYLTEKNVWMSTDIECTNTHCDGTSCTFRHKVRLTYEQKTAIIEAGMTPVPDSATNYHVSHMQHVPVPLPPQGFPMVTHTDAFVAFLWAQNQQMQQQILALTERVAALEFNSSKSFPPLPTLPPLAPNLAKFFDNMSAPVSEMSPSLKNWKN